MALPPGYDRWKLASPSDDVLSLAPVEDIQPGDMVLTTQCDVCGLHDHDEHIIVVGEENLCKDCGEDAAPGLAPVEAIPDDHYIQCEGCGIKVPEDEAIPINDGSTEAQSGCPDNTPRVCGECGRSVLDD